MRVRSLALRLILAAGGWTALALATGGFILSAIFSDYVVQSFDARLAALQESLIAIAEIGADGRPTFTRPLGEPRFDRAFSGWYWQIEAPGGELLRSRSLWDQSLARSADGVEIVGPAEEPLRLFTRRITLPGADGEFVFTVAGDRGEIDEQIAAFNTVLAWSLAVLGLGLVAAIVIQVRFGLRPLRHIRRAIVAVRTGKAQRLQGEFPVEIAPLSDEINTLLEHNADVIERARTQVSNLAHALKTPLSVLTNEAGTAAGPLAETVRRQAASMRQHVDHYLARARTAASARVLGARTEAAPVVDDLRRTLERMHAGRGIHIETSVAPGLGFRGERQDFEEMLGNLMDNACKWAGSRVRVAAQAGGGRLVCSVDDDAVIADLDLGDGGHAVLAAGLGLVVLDLARGVGDVRMGEADAGAEQLDAAAGAGRLDHGRLEAGRLGEPLRDRGGKGKDGARADDADLIPGQGRRGASNQQRQQRQYGASEEPNAGVDRRRASFETAASRPPQDDDRR